MDIKYHHFIQVEKKTKIEVRIFIHYYNKLQGRQEKKANFTIMKFFHFSTGQSLLVHNVEFKALDNCEMFSEIFHSTL